MGAIAAASAQLWRGPPMSRTQDASLWSGNNFRPKLEGTGKVQASRAADSSSSSSLCYFLSEVSAYRCMNFGTGATCDGASSSRWSSGSISCAWSGGFWTSRCDNLRKARTLERSGGCWITLEMGGSSIGSMNIGRRRGEGWQPLRRRRRNIKGIVMRSGGDKNDNNAGEDQVETLFMRELRRRGMASKEQEGGSVGSTGTDTKTKEGDTERRGPFGRGWSPRGDSQTKPQTDDQLKRSMALNSEGLDGLYPRAKELLKLGSTFFLSLWPAILATLVAFLAVYLYFGPAFVHVGDKFQQAKRPPNVDPYELLGEERIPSRIGPDRVPYNSRFGAGDSP